MRKLFRFFVRVTTIIFVIIFTFIALHECIRLISEKYYRHDEVKQFNTFTFRADQYTELVAQDYEEESTKEHVTFCVHTKDSYCEGYIGITSSSLSLESLKSSDQQYERSQIGGIVGEAAAYELILDRVGSSLEHDFLFVKNNRSYFVKYSDYDMALVSPPGIWYSIEDVVHRLGYDQHNVDTESDLHRYLFPNVSFDLIKPFYVSGYSYSKGNKSDFKIKGKDSYEDAGVLRLEISPHRSTPFPPDKPGVRWEQIDLNGHTAYRNHLNWEIYVDLNPGYAHIYPTDQPAPYVISNTLMYKVFLDSLSF